MSAIELQVGVKVLLKNKEGKFLIIRRSLEKYPEVKDRWGIVGGRIDPGTSLLKNLKREIREETGLELSGEPRLIAAQDILPPGRHVVRLTYLGEADGEVVLDEENDEYRWVGKDELSSVEGMDGYFKNALKDAEPFL